MTIPLSAIWLALFGLTLILTTLSLWLLRGTPAQSEPVTTPARFFLIALRLAIGWHCFFEGMEKINTPNWSSEGYLRESMGPLAKYYRDLAGDRVVEKLTAVNDAFPPLLDRDWRAYLDAFASHYDLTSEQENRATGILDQREKDTLTYLLSKSEEVIKVSPFPPPLPVNMTMKERLAEYNRLLKKVREIEEEFPSSSVDILTKKMDVHEKWKSAKADLAKWRAELKKSLDAQTAKMKEALEDVLTSEQKLMGPVPEVTTLPDASSSALEWSDFLIKWGLVVLGGCLMVGLFSRLSCFATALLILSFYAAMPPLPGWPESPKLEGHYVLINKTLIEALALLALAFIPTGRWAGIDGLLYLPFSGRSRG